MSRQVHALFIIPSEVILNCDFMLSIFLFLANIETNIWHHLCFIKPEINFKYF